MVSSNGIKILAAALALAISGSALANTTSTDSPDGTVFLNITDPTSGDTFFFDTGLTASTFSGGGSYNFNVASDPNYQAFLAAVGSDALNYSVISGTVNSTATSAAIDFTTNNTPAAATGQHIAQGVVAIGTFLQNADLITSTTANSNWTTGGSNNSGSWLSAEPTVQNKLGPLIDSAAIGTALNFYTTGSSSLRSTGNSGTTLAEFSGTWDLSSGGLLTYSAPAAVPLPTPVLLLLSGLGLMGVVSRRNKAAV